MTDGCRFLPVIRIVAVLLGVWGLVGGCAGPRTTYEESLRHYGDAWDDRKLRHAALHFLVAEYAKGTPKTSPEYQLLAELDSLDIHNPRDSARAEEIYLLALRDLDPNKLTPENEFFNQLKERLEWIVNKGSCWHPYNAIVFQFDELAQDVLLLGVPESDDDLPFGGDYFSLVYPEAGWVRRAYYRCYGSKMKLPLLGVEFKRVPTQEEFERTRMLNYALGRHYECPGCIRRDANKLVLRDVAEQSGQCYTEVPYEPLSEDDMSAEAVAIPGPGLENWDGRPEHYGTVPWNNTAVIINIAANVRPFIRRDSTGLKTATLAISYNILDPANHRVLDSGSMQKIITVDSTSGKNDKVITQLFTNWFHTVDATPRPVTAEIKQKDYLLGLRVTAPDGKIWEESYHLSLPNHYPTIPVYQGMLVTARAGRNPHINIPPPRVNRTIKRGDTILVWAPAVGLSYTRETKTYRGHAVVYLTPRFNLRGRVSIGPILPADSVDAEVMNADQGVVSSRAIPVDVALLSAACPNSYQVVRFVVPKVPDGDYTLGVVIHAEEGGDRRLGGSRVPVDAGFVDVTID